MELVIAKACPKHYFFFIQNMAHGRGIYMCDRPGPCYKYGKIIILSRVLCNISVGDTQTVEKENGTVYVIKNVANILPYCVINNAQKQKVLAKLGGRQPGKNLHKNVSIFVSFKVLGPQIPLAPAHVSNGMSAITGSTLTEGL